MYSLVWGGRIHHHHLAAELVFGDEEVHTDVYLLLFGVLDEDLGSFGSMEFGKQYIFNDFLFHFN